MMPPESSDHKILEVKRFIESENRSQIRLNANGGNAVLVVCEPMLEKEYIASIKELLPIEKYEVIDLSELLLRFVDENKDHLDDLFELLQGSPQQIFKASDREDRPDLFSMIITAIKEVYQRSNVPVLIGTGSLYGSGIENIQIVEHNVVIQSSIPLIILYPATHDGDQMLFLGKRPSSKYRCMII